MATALVGIGSNLGDPAATVGRTIELIAKLPGVAAVRGSRLYRARPVGGPAGQREFVNAAARLETSLSPDALLVGLRAIEAQFGRTRTERWAARTLDLDLLLFDEIILQDADLTLPHPRMSFRRFVLEPAAEVAAEMRHPIFGCAIGELLDHLNTAAQYVAIGGLGDRTWLAGAVARELGGPLLLEHPRGSAEGPTPPSALETLKQPICLVRRELWSASPQLRPLLDPVPAGAAPFSASGPVVSNFWIEDFRLWACLDVSEESIPPERAASQMLLKWFETEATETVAPKLVIWLDDPQPLGPAQQGRLPKCLARLFREARCRALLRLDGSDPDKMLAESLAAIEAMQPLEGVVS